MAGDTREIDEEQEIGRPDASKYNRKLSQAAPDLLQKESTAPGAPRKLQANDESRIFEPPVPAHQVYFHRAIQFAIVVNSAQMGLEFSFREGSWPQVWDVCDHFFTAFFLLEAMIKLYPSPKLYFTDKNERAWNCVDFFVVIVTVLDMWILQVAIGGPGANMSSELQAMKVIRLVRLSRVMRLLKEQKDLMMVVIGIVGSLKSMAWVGVLLIVVVYASAIACCTLIGNADAYTEDNPEINFSNTQGQVSLARAMFTLFNLSLGQGHMETMNPLFANQIYMLFFMFPYVMVVTVGILNSVIGIICEKTAEAGRANLEEEHRVFKDKQRGMVETLKTLIWEMNEDGDGIISQEELDTAANDPKFVQMLKEINLPASFSVTDMHLMLDKDGDGELTEEEFADGMYDLVYSNDFQRQCILLRSLANAKRNLHEFRSEVTREFKDLRALITREMLNPRKQRAPTQNLEGGATAPVAVTPPLPGGKPPAFGCPPGLLDCVGVWDVLDHGGSNPENTDQAIMKQVRANALKAVAVGAWELLEQDGAVQEELAKSGNLVAMKQVRARAMKAAAERTASRSNLQNPVDVGRSSAPGALRAAAGGSELARPPVPSEVAPKDKGKNLGFEEFPSSDAPQLPGAYPSCPTSPNALRPLPQAREEVETL